MKKKCLLATLFALLSAFLLFGCLGFGPQGEPYLVPDKADGYAVLKPSAILSDQDLLKSMNETSRIDFEKSLNEAKDTYGFDPAAITKIIIFMNAEKEAPEAYTGIIAEGTFDKQKLIGKIREDASVTEEQYDGTTVYKIVPNSQNELDPGQDVRINPPISTSYLAFVTDRQVVYGIEESVKDCIDVKNGKRKALSDGTLDRMSKAVDSDGVVLVVMKIPALWTNAIAQSGSGPYDTTSFSKATHLAFSYGKTGPTMSLKSSVLFRGANDAQKSSDVLQGLLSMARGLSKSGSASEKLLRDIKVNANGEMLSASLEVTKETLDKIEAEMKEQANTQTAQTYSTGPDYGTGGTGGVKD